MSYSGEHFIRCPARAQFLGTGNEPVHPPGATQGARSPPRCALSAGGVFGGASEPGPRTIQVAADLFRYDGPGLVSLGLLVPDGALDRSGGSRLVTPHRYR